MSDKIKYPKSFYMHMALFNHIVLLGQNQVPSNIYTYGSGQPYLDDRTKQSTLNHFIHMALVNHILLKGQNKVLSNIVYTWLYSTILY